MKKNKPIVIECADIYVRFPEIMEEEYKDLIEFLDDEHILFERCTSKFYSLHQENAELKRQIEIMEKYLELIVDLGFDFDGCNTVESLKGLVEELTRFASLARACNTTETVYDGGDGKRYNILHEEVNSNGEI